MHTFFQWPTGTSPAAPTASLPATAPAVPAPAFSDAQAAQGNNFHSSKTHKNRPQRTHSKSLMSHQDHLERTRNELPTARSSPNTASRPSTSVSTWPNSVVNSKMTPPGVGYRLVAG
jgi:hypothetical protein